MKHPDVKPSDAICVLASGGIDSAVLLAESLGTSAAVYPVYVRFGLRWESAELYWLAQYLDAIQTETLQPLTTLDLPMQDVYQEHWSIAGIGVPGTDSEDAAVYLPGRNLLLIGKAAIFCAQRNIARIAIGTLSGNPFPDATETFRRMYSQVLSQALGMPIAIEAPYAALHKRDLLKRGASLPLHLTFTCLSPNGHSPCGRCNKCEERRRAVHTL